jgi:Homeodomain-like domain
MNGTLYHLGFPNGKGYIGITIRTPEQRLREHVLRSEKCDRLPVYRAIRKHGAPTLTVLESGIKSRNALLALEKWAIASFNTHGAGGYNASPGGENASAWLEFADEERLAIWRKAQREKLAAHYAIPENKEALLKRLAVQNADPEIQARRIAGIRRATSDPEWLRKTRERNKARAKIAPENHSAVLAMLAAGVSYKQTAAHFGISKSTIGNIKRANQQEVKQ